MNKYDDSIAPRFMELANDFFEDGGKYTHYVLKGGRLSCKSSFIALTLITLMSAVNEDGTAFCPNQHAVALRKFAVYLAGSVYNRLLWAINTLNINDEWIKHRNPLELIHKRNNNKIIFLGGDETERLKSINPSSGYFRFIWFEEYSEFGCEEDIRNILQSLMRGGDKFTVFYSYNPPKSVNNWVNAWAINTLKRDDVIVHHSTYRTVPEEWVGKPVIREINELRNNKPMAYRHEYLGEATGTGGSVFDNITLRPITDDEINRFEYIYRGIDWGFAADPFVYIVCSYDSTHRRLYIFYEYYAVGVSTETIIDVIRKENKNNKTIIADSDEPRSNDELIRNGIRVEGAKKGPGSVDFGISWLQKRLSIIIDPARCPNAAREYIGYELERDKFGNFKGSFPDKNNHTIDPVRYACEKIMIPEIIYKPVKSGRRYTDFSKEIWRGNK